MTISINDFEHWLSNSKPGSSIVYHQGFLAQDVLYVDGLVEMRRATWRAYEEGLVILTQRRKSGQAEYIAQRCGV